MSRGDTEPSELHGGEAPAAVSLVPASRVTFDRRELNRIFSLYGRKVAAGEWRDYAIDFLKDRAVFSVFRRAILEEVDGRSEEHTSELQSLRHLVCRLLL